MPLVLEDCSLCKTSFSSSVLLLYDTLTLPTKMQWIDCDGHSSSDGPVRFLPFGIHYWGYKTSLSSRRCWDTCCFGNDGSEKISLVGDTWIKSRKNKMGNWYGLDLCSYQISCGDIIPDIGGGACWEVIGSSWWFFLNRLAPSHLCCSSDSK